MRKYIRTPLGIWRVVEENELMYRVVAKGNPHHTYNKSKCQTEVIKKASTIEELCDEFVCESNEKGNDFRCHYHDIVRLKYDSFYAEYREHYNFYGSIYIKGKGLIHVAKLNPKTGELELL